MAVGLLGVVREHVDAGNERVTRFIVRHVEIISGGDGDDILDVVVWTALEIDFECNPGSPSIRDLSLCSAVISLNAEGVAFAWCNLSVRRLGPVSELDVVSNPLQVRSGDVVGDGYRGSAVHEIAKVGL